jgi:excinuclease ABC subunit C
VIFVGKSTNLSRRLSQLYEEKDVPGGSQRPHKRYLELGPDLLARMDTIEIILLHNEAECIFLINGLIARYHPPFNLATFIEPVEVGTIVLTAERFPRLLPRGKKRGMSSEPGEVVFGPFPGGAVRDLILKAVREEFGLRSCDPLPATACFMAETGICCAPCVARTSQAEYAQRVGAAAKMLSAAPAELIEGLENQVSAAAERLDFERAKRLHDQLKLITAGYRHLAALPPVSCDQDAVYAQRGLAVIAHYQAGRLRGIDYAAAEGDAQQFIEAHYQTDCPEEIICPAFAETAPTTPWLPTAARLESRCGHKVTIRMAQGGPEAVQLDVARMNHAWMIRNHLAG